MEPLCCHHLNLFSPPSLYRDRRYALGNRTTEAWKTPYPLSRTTCPQKPALFSLSSFRRKSLLPECFGQLVPLGCTGRPASTCGLSTSSSATALWRDLILEMASCLDAFSTYPNQTLLPGGAPRRDNRYTGGLSSTVLSY